MAKRNKIVEGLRDAISYAKGDTTAGGVTRFQVPQRVDVRAIRERLGLSQGEFALRFGFSLGTLRHWEQGRRHPEGSARVLLTIINRAPDLVEQAISDVARQQKRVRAVRERKVAAVR